MANDSDNGSTPPSSHSASDYLTFPAIDQAGWNDCYHRFWSTPERRERTAEFLTQERQDRIARWKKAGWSLADSDDNL